MLVDTLKNGNTVYARSRWNQDGNEWSADDEQRYETYHVRQSGNVILHMYREWTKDGPYWSPEGGDLYSREYDFGAKNIDVREITIPESVHSELLELARDIPEEVVEDESE